MEILFNQDGSIVKFIPNKYIQQGNNNVDKITVGIIDLDLSQYQAVANFELPNGDTHSTFITGNETIYYDGETYPARSFYLTENETLFAGRLYCSISFVNLNTTLFTYRCEFVINKTPFNPDEVNITYTEYNNLVKALENKMGGFPETVVIEPTSEWDFVDENRKEFDLREYKGKVVKIELGLIDTSEMTIYDSPLIISLLFTTDFINAMLDSDISAFEIDSGTFDRTTGYNDVNLYAPQNRLEDVLNGGNTLYVDLTTPIVKIVLRWEEN